ncbi:AMP-dependent synthetase/ligase [Flagellimonas onchidii]|uniref:AMP-dependent synthetase/ligase n=1 Tax=Flagellimonas onchidii TaxID=2562684 RepID=UPI0010A6AB8B|nr:AMP-dependent synthetase/ligase [Allomuricauda onchidii]
MQKVTRLFDFPYYQLEKNPLEKALVTKYDGKWEATSTQKFIDRANALSRGLLRLGVKPNDKIAVISSTNRTEWCICDIGILQVGAQNVPIYPTISKDDYEYVLNHSEATYCFVSDEEVLQKILAISGKVKKLKDVYSFDRLSNCNHWTEVLEKGEDTSNQEELEEKKANVKPEDLATLIYTSGTTGRPKGVMLSHDNIVSNALSAQQRIPLGPGDIALSFLPLCHIFERTFSYVGQYLGLEIHFAEGLDKISDNIKEVHPDFMTVVPRLVEKVFDAIIAKGSALTGIKKKLFFWAVELGLKFEPYGKNGWWYEKKLGLARKLIFSKWKEALGGNLQFMASGSAALQPRLGHVFGASGMPIMECYGLTETSPGVSVSQIENNGWKIGKVGRVMDGVEVKIAQDGEILCKGPNIMMGYYKDPEKTAEVIKDGYFHTGDIGEIDEDGFLMITDRKKEMFKTSGGKYVAPQLLENKLKQSRFVEQVMVVGEGEKMPAALIQPNFEFLYEWANRHNITLSENSDIILNEKVISRIQDEIDVANEDFAKWEKVKQFRLTPDVWSIDDGHMTPTMKLRRKIIKEKYIDLYNGIYGH